jgi:hypothetical protein
VGGEREAERRGEEEMADHDLRTPDSADAGLLFLSAVSTVATTDNAQEFSGERVRSQDR